MEKIIEILKKPNILICFLVLILMGIGSINVLSASYIDAEDMSGNGYYFFFRYVIFAAISFLAMLVVSKIDYHRFLTKNSLWFFYIVVLGMLIVVDAIGIANKGAQRWLYLGPVSIQPSELAKVFVIMFTAKLLGDAIEKNKKISLFSGVGRFCVLASMVLSGLVYLQPDLGTAAIIAGLMVCVFIVAGISKSQIMALLGTGLAGAVVFTVSTPYRLERIKVWFDPWLDEMGAGYQMVLSLLTIGSGGLVGTNWGQGTGKYLYLPESHTDFAFAVYCQENGFIGAVFLMILFLLLGCALFKIAVTAKDKRGFLLVSGITFLIVGQAFANMAMVCGIFPVIGVPLVFISYGGSSMMISAVSLGLALSVYNMEQRQLDIEQNITLPQSRRNDLRVVSRRHF